MPAQNPDVLGGWRLIRAGVVLLSVGTLSGFLIAIDVSPIMGLAAHLTAVLDAFMLLTLGIVWPRLTMHLGTSALASNGLILGASMIFTTMAICAAMGIGGTVFPIIDSVHVGTHLQELIVKMSATVVSVITVLGVGAAALGAVRSSGL